MSEYSGRHRPATRAERRAIERRSRLPKSFGPAYLVPTAAAATLVLTAAGATAASSSSFAGGAGTQAGAAFLAEGQDKGTTSLLSDPALGDDAREEVAASAQESSGLATRRQAVSTSVAKDQGRTQERKRVARDAARKEIAADKKRDAKIAADKKRDETSSTTPATSSSSTSSDTPAQGAQGAQSWVKPLDNAVFTSPFGTRWGKLHAGQDYAASIGTPLKAMSSGTVIGAGPMSGYGNYIDVKYWDGTVSRYGHLSSISASVGQQVSTGDVVALSGNTGHSTGPHLHMEIHPGGGGAIDPAGWLAERGIS
ncbi:M23 family metallopeptidase [Janibacter sp. Soil728]|uniref:M23 family metallopeptidase n=1 Tax=Janibacter sp. Soil728 TaxID=1736393 RepID=UPI000AE3503B|nr:M23 family metallopeptidase [Janibacter sp. Soil728]